MFKNISPDSVRSGKFGCPVLSGQETHMLSPVEPYRIANLAKVWQELALLTPMTLMTVEQNSTYFHKTCSLEFAL